jgi:hypothetical protein
MSGDQWFAWSQTSGVVAAVTLECICWVNSSLDVNIYELWVYSSLVPLPALQTEYFFNLVVRVDSPQPCTSHVQQLMADSKLWQ